MNQNSIWIVCEMGTPKRKNIQGKENPMDKGKRVELSIALWEEGLQCRKRAFSSTH